MLRLHLMYRDVEYAGNQRSLHVWRIRAVSGKTLVVRFANGALVASRTEVDGWIAAILERSRRELPPGAYYQVLPDGIHVMGVDEIRFEHCGQLVHCVVESGTAPVWRLSVDGRDCGAVLRADPEQAQDEVARMAVDWLYVNGHLRVPPPPWSWSVRDRTGSEWWVRVELGSERESRGAGRTLVLFEPRSDREHRMSWDSPAMTPSARELREVIAQLVVRRS